jgi:hypothetical protein
MVPTRRTTIVASGRKFKGAGWSLRRIGRVGRNAGGSDVSVSRNIYKILPAKRILSLIIVSDGCSNSRGDKI